MLHYVLFLCAVLLLLAEGAVNAVRDVIVLLPRLAVQTAFVAALVARDALASATTPRSLGPPKSASLGTMQNAAEATV